MKKVVAIVQARMGSTRLPQKVFKEIDGRPMLWHVVDRLKRAKLIDEIVVATTTKEEDKLIIQLAKDSNVEGYAGSEKDVLDRYYQAARTYKTDIIVRITADCPLIDPEVVDKVIKYFLEGDFDYVSNTNVGARMAHKQTYPVGLDTEVFSFNALQRAWNEAKMLSEREHVTPYIWKNPKIFKVSSVEYGEDLSHIRLTVDYEQDLRFVREIYRRLHKDGEIFCMKEILTLLSEHAELMDINKGIVRNEGYFKSSKKRTKS